MKTRILQLAMGLLFLCAITVWGATEPQIAAGDAISAALKWDGTVWEWGSNLHDEGVAYGLASSGRDAPELLGELNNVVAIAPYMAVTSDGKTWTWGWHLGDGDGSVSSRKAPRVVNGLSDVVAVSAGYDFKMALQSNGSLWSWGGNYYGQLGLPYLDRLVPEQIGGISGVVAVAAGGYHTAAVKSDGTVWTWGWNEHGQGGVGDYSRRKTPGPIGGFGGVVAVAAGSDHTLALKSDGTIWSWGANDKGQLGDGTTTTRLSPVQVKGLTNVIAIAAGGVHSAALTYDGRVWTWGSISSMQLDDGPHEPVLVSSLHRVIAIAVGGWHTLALRSDGTVWAWGSNAAGQIGIGKTRHSDFETPVQIKGFYLGPIYVDKLQAKLNFAKPDTDSCKLTVLLPPGECGNWSGKTVSVNIAGARVTWTLNEQGRGVNANGTCRVSSKKSTGVCTLTAKLIRGSWHTAWAAHGLTNATITKPGESVGLPVTIDIAGKQFTTEKPLIYTATHNKSGQGKQF